MNAGCVCLGLDTQEPPWFVRNDTAINGIITLAGWQLVPRTNSGDAVMPVCMKVMRGHRLGSKRICPNYDFPKCDVPFLHLFCDMKVRKLLI